MAVSPGCKNAWMWRWGVWGFQLTEEIQESEVQNAISIVMFLAILAKVSQGIKAQNDRSESLLLQKNRHKKQCWYISKQQEYSKKWILN
jgi:hypothetical protein